MSDNKLKTVAGDFKKFIFKGNIIDMAVGVIIGGAFGKIVTSLVNDILMPLLGAAMGGASFNTLKWVLKPAVLDAAGEVVTAEAAVLYGNFIQNVVDFLIIGVCMFTVIKTAAAVSEKMKKEEEAPAPAAPAGPTTEELLAEIRDLLKEKNA